MKHASLFSGIGGFDLAAEWMGWENAFHCEIDKFCQRVLKYYWPKAITYEDIKKTDFTIHRGTIDILTGGFPCQPYSTAGKRLGKEDDRHLWPEMLRVIREIQPRYVVGENVRGLINWNKGMVFDEVQADLENAGYEVWPFILPACAVNAPHRRDRVWFITNSNASRNSGKSQKHDRSSEKKQIQERDKIQRFIESNTILGITPNATSKRLQREQWEKHKRGRERFTNNSKFITNTDSELPQRRGSKNKSKEAKRHFSPPFCGNAWENFPTQSPICSGNDGLSDRLDGITFPKWRRESIKAYGNAIVPQVAFEIFKAIEEVEKHTEL